jgi:membrane glycosyltransferase
MTPRLPDLPGPGTVSLVIPARRWRLPLFLTLVAGTLLGGVWMMLGILASGGLTWLEAVILVLFVPTFGWISLAFWTAVLGFGLQLLRVDPLTLRRVAEAPDGAVAVLLKDAVPLAEDVGRTAVVMPARNEDPVQAMEGLAAMAAALRSTGSGHAFDLHFLSDTTDPGIAAQEEEIWRELHQRWTRAHAGERGAPSLFYRRRSDNTGRKPGNIGAFCREHGADYRYLVVLDADSRMAGSTLVTLVRTMEANPGAGLIQTVPLPAGQATLFGRLLQFAGALYGPMLARGYSFWQADSANYWGHNAILRLAPFFQHGHLPVLPGRPPLGGEILSHDFVEGALLRRAGWTCYLLTELGGSHEGLPGNLVDFARRDRRWAQGSLQHLRLLLAPGFRPISRLHFVTGAMGYLSSVFWFFLLVAGTVYVGLAEWQERYASFAGTGGWQSVALTEAGWERVDAGARSGWEVPEALLPPGGMPGSLLVATGILLFLPRVLAVLAGWVRGSHGFGGRLRLAGSAFLETGFTVVMAPVLMWSHTRFVAGILAGRTVRWEAQDREGREVGWEESWRWARGATLLGVTWSAAALAVSPLFTLWLAPILTGLVLAVPLVQLTSRTLPGTRARLLGLFLAPSEPRPGEAGPGEQGPVRRPSAAGATPRDRPKAPPRRPPPAPAEVTHV